MPNTIELIFKTPDVIDRAIEDLVDHDKEWIPKALEKWIKYGEYVTLIFDLKTHELTVRKHQ